MLQRPALKDIMLLQEVLEIISYFWADTQADRFVSRDRVADHKAHRFVTHVPRLPRCTQLHHFAACRPPPCRAGQSKT